MKQICFYSCILWLLGCRKWLGNVLFIAGSLQKDDFFWELVESSWSLSTHILEEEGDSYNLAGFVSESVFLEQLIPVTIWQPLVISHQEQFLGAIWWWVFMLNVSKWMGVLVPWKNHPPNSHVLLVSNKKCPLPAGPFATFQGLPFSGSGGTCYPSLLRSSHLLTRDHWSFFQGSSK